MKKSGYRMLIRFSKFESFLCFPRNSRGVGLVTAIVVIAALAMLGTVMMQLIVNERSASNRSVASLRAFLAAKTAIQWSMYNIKENPSLTPSKLEGSVFNETNLENSSSLGQCAGETEVVDTSIDYSTAKGKGYNVEVEGACYPGTNSETRRRLEVRFGPDY